MMTKEKKDTDTSTKKGDKGKFTISFNLKSVKTFVFSIKEPEKPFNQKEPSIVNFLISPSERINAETGEFSIQLDVKGTIVETKEEFFFISTNFNYLVKDMKKIVDSSDKKKVSELFKILIGISISTLRGIIIEKGKGTILETQLLPIVSPAQFLKNK